MNIYSVRHDGDHYQWLNFSDFSQFDAVEATPIGRPVSPSLNGIHASRVTPESEDYCSTLVPGDFVGLGPVAFALGPRAMNAAGSIFLDCGQLLPVVCDTWPQPLLWFHCTTVLDALDEERTVGGRLPDGRMYRFDRLWFFGDRLHGAALFKIPQAKSMLLCTDTVKDRITSAGLTGLNFHLRWSDERPGREAIARWELRAFKGALPPMPFDS